MHLHFGQNVNAYSYIDGSREYRLSDLINTLSKYDEISRIRYTTSHPRDMTDDLIECYKNSKKLMPFVHLPIQSGSDRILKMMNRKHTVKYYLNIYEKLIKINPDIKFSSDFIIGYPGETDNDFKETINLVNKIKFIKIRRDVIGNAVEELYLYLNIYKPFILDNRNSTT